MDNVESLGQCVAGKVFFIFSRQRLYFHFQHILEHEHFPSKSLRRSCDNIHLHAFLLQKKKQKTPSFHHWPNVRVIQTHQELNNFSLHLFSCLLYFRRFVPLHFRSRLALHSFGSDKSWLLLVCAIQFSSFILFDQHTTQRCATVQTECIIPSFLYVSSVFRPGRAPDLIHNRLTYGSDNRTIASLVGYLWMKSILSRICIEGSPNTPGTSLGGRFAHMRRQKTDVWCVSRWIHEAVWREWCVIWPVTDLSFGLFKFFWGSTD